MKIRRTIQWLSLVLVVPFLGGATEAATPDGAGTVPAKCTITVKARLDPGALGKEMATLVIGWGQLSKSSRVRIKGGTWSKLGNQSTRHVRFNPDGTWKEFYSQREGSGQWSGQVQLNMGCRYRRRYEFRITRGTQSGPTAEVRPQYPSTSGWTQEQTINLGNLARYF